MSPYEAVRKLERTDVTDAFDCGQLALNRYLQRFALPNQKAGGAQTYVCCVDRRVAGFYALAVGSVQPVEAPIRISQGLSRNPIPIMLLARLAVDITHQHKGLGRALLRDALLRTLQAADIAGIRAILVHAKDDAARGWYERVGFEPSPTDSHHLFLLLKDIRAAFAR